MNGHKGFSTARDEQLARQVSFLMCESLAGRLAAITIKHCEGALHLCAECALPWPCWTYAKAVEPS